MAQHDPWSTHTFVCCIRRRLRCRRRKQHRRRCLRRRRRWSAQQRPTIINTDVIHIIGQCSNARPDVAIVIQYNIQLYHAPISVNAHLFVVRACVRASFPLIRFTSDDDGQANVR